MSESITQPVLAVLTGTGTNDEFAVDAEIRLADAGTLSNALSGADVLLVWHPQTAGIAEAWRAADTSAVKWVHTASAGVDRVTFPELLSHPAQITNARGVFDLPIAEYVTGLVLALAKDIHRTVQLQGQKRWLHRQSHTVQGRNAVIVGSGPIGRAIAHMLSMVGISSSVIGRRACDGVHAFDELPELLPSTDFLVLAAPLTELTRGLLRQDTIRQLPGSAYVINVGRGGLVVEPDLVEALRDGAIAGAALDVYENEPLPTCSPLWTLDNVIISPHMSGNVTERWDLLRQQFVENFQRFRAGQPLHNIVDKTVGYVRGAQ